MWFPFDAEGPVTRALCWGEGVYWRGVISGNLSGLRSNPRWKQKNNSNGDVWREYSHKSDHIWWNRAIWAVTSFRNKNWYFYPKFAYLLTAPLSLVGAINQLTEGTYPSVEAQKFWCNFHERFGRYGPINPKNAQFWAFFEHFLAFWALFFDRSSFLGMPKISV